MKKKYNLMATSMNEFMKSSAQWEPVNTEPMDKVSANNLRIQIMTERPHLYIKMVKVK